MKQILVVSTLAVCIGSAILTKAQVSAPVLRFSVYPLVQPDAPLEIVDVKYRPEAMQIILVNRTDRVITGASVVARITAPYGCSLGEARVGEIGGGDFNLHLNPHEKLILHDATSPLNLTALVLVAQDEKVAGVQVQAGVEEVVFGDGTKWRPSPDPRLPTHGTRQPFNRALVEADSGMCSSPEAVIDALAGVKGSTFDNRIGPSQTLIARVSGESVQHIVFECALERTAVCPAR